MQNTLDAIKAGPFETAVHELLLKRWSPRAFSDEMVSRDDSRIKFQQQLAALKDGLLAMAHVQEIESAVEAAQRRAQRNLYPDASNADKTCGRSLLPHHGPHLLTTSSRGAFSSTLKVMRRISAFSIPWCRVLHEHFRFRPSS